MDTVVWPVLCPRVDDTRVIKMTTDVTAAALELGITPRAVVLGSQMLEGAKPAHPLQRFGQAPGPGWKLVVVTTDPPSLVGILPTGGSDPSPATVDTPLLSQTTAAAWAMYNQARFELCEHTCFNSQLFKTAQTALVAAVAQTHTEVETRTKLRATSAPGSPSWMFVPPRNRESGTWPAVCAWEQGVTKGVLNVNSLEFEAAMLGTGTATTVLLQTAQALFTGLPCSPPVNVSVTTMWACGLHGLPPAAGGGAGCPTLTPPIDPNVYFAQAVANAKTTVRLLEGVHPCETWGDATKTALAIQHNLATGMGLLAFGLVQGTNPHHTHLPGTNVFEAAATLCIQHNCASTGSAPAVEQDVLNTLDAVLFKIAAATNSAIKHFTIAMDLANTMTKTTPQAPSVVLAALHRLSSDKEEAGAGAGAGAGTGGDGPATLSKGGEDATSPAQDPATPDDFWNAVPPGEPTPRALCGVQDWVLALAALCTAVARGVQLGLVLPLLILQLDQDGPESGSEPAPATKAATDLGPWGLIAASTAALWCADLPRDDAPEFMQLAGGVAAGARVWGPGLAAAAQLYAGQDPDQASFGAPGNTFATLSRPLLGRGKPTPVSSSPGHSPGLTAAWTTMLNFAAAIGSNTHFAASAP